jgi:hypothetical protein
LTSTRTATATRTQPPPATSTRTATVTPTISLTFTVSPTPSPVLRYHVVLRFYDTSGALVRTLDAGHSDAAVTALTLSSNPFDPLKGPLVISQGGWSVSFDGRADSGEYLLTGPYLVKAFSDDGGGAAVAQASFNLLLGQADTLTALYAVPNPATGNKVDLFWFPSVAVDLEIFNQAGELIWRTRVKGPGPAQWNLRTVSGQPATGGVYVIMARQPGKKMPRLFKLAVVK